MTTPPQEFTGRRALVTGAARGIGRAIAEQLTAGGAQVVLCDQLDSVADTAATMRDALALQADVRDSDGIAAWLTEHHAWPDILVNNAAIAPARPVADLDATLLLETYAINTVAGIVLARLVADRLIATSRPGSIVNVASVNAYRGHPQLVHYNASKAAMLSATRTLAVEWSGHGIRVNAVCPGTTRTDIWPSDGYGNENEEDFGKKNLLGRVAEPAEIAAAVCFLASDRASFVTGSELTVDGGLMVNLP